MNTKNILGIVALVLVLGTVFWFRGVDDAAVTGDQRQPGTEDIVVDDTGGKLKAATFTGKLEDVNVGCFVDGECYVVVDGKHVTTILGWRQEVVGSVKGVEGFGDLEQHIGEEMEVYAQDKGGTYTLYGSSGFYVKLLNGTI
jgi:hypothetical protein